MGRNTALPLIVALLTDVWAAMVRTQNSSVLTQRGPTPIDYRKLDNLLTGYPWPLRSFLVKGFEHGFEIVCDKFPYVINITNHTSAMNNPLEVDKLIMKEPDPGGR